MAGIYGTPLGRERVTGGADRYGIPGRSNVTGGAAVSEGFSTPQSRREHTQELLRRKKKIKEISLPAPVTAPPVEPVTAPPAKPGVLRLPQPAREPLPEPKKEIPKQRRMRRIDGERGPDMSFGIVKGRRTI
jgi:hypothetical protein